MINEREVLTEFYHSTQGAAGGWLRSNNWLSNAPLGDWEGVGTDTGHASGRVRKLVLCSNNLCGRIPDSLGQLVYLEELWLDNNLLDGYIPWRLGALTNLTILGLSSNKLSGAIPDALANLRRLEVLEVQYNNLGGELPSVILEHLPLLIKLDVSSNPLQGKLPESIASSRFLEHVAVYNTGVGGTIPATLEKCLHLDSLILYESLFVGATPTFFLTMPFLRELELSRCYFDEPAFGKRDFHGQFRDFAVKFFFHGQSSPSNELTRRLGELKDDWKEQSMLAYHQNKTNPYVAGAVPGDQLRDWVEARISEQIHGGAV
jgi:hypothetical protein